MLCQKNYQIRVFAEVYLRNQLSAVQELRNKRNHHHQQNMLIISHHDSPSYSLPSTLRAQSS